MKDDENCLRKILEIRVSRFLIDRTSQMVEFKFFNFFRSIEGHIGSIEERKLEIFLSVFTCKKNKTMCN